MDGESKVCLTFNQRFESLSPTRNGETISTYLFSLSSVSSAIYNHFTEAKHWTGFRISLNDKKRNLPGDWWKANKIIDTSWDISNIPSWIIARWFRGLSSISQTASNYFKRKQRVDRFYNLKMSVDWWYYKLVFEFFSNLIKPSQTFAKERLERKFSKNSSVKNFLKILRSSTNQLLSSNKPLNYFRFLSYWLSKTHSLRTALQIGLTHRSPL